MAGHALDTADVRDAALAPRLPAVCSAVMTVRALDGTSFDAYVGEPAVVGFVRRRDPASGELLTLLEALAAGHGPRVGFATVDIDDCLDLAARFAIDRVPTAILFHDYRSAGRVADPIARAELEHLIATRLA